MPSLPESLKLLQYNANNNIDCLNSERLAPKAENCLQEPRKESFATESLSSLNLSPNIPVKDPKQQFQKPEEKENFSVEQASESEVSSVELDSDDSDFCTTIDIVNLKPNKKKPNFRLNANNNTESNSEAKQDQPKQTVLNKQK